MIRLDSEALGFFFVTRCIRKFEFAENCNFFLCAKQCDGVLLQGSSQPYVIDLIGIDYSVFLISYFSIVKHGAQLPSLSNEYIFLIGPHGHQILDIV